MNTITLFVQVEGSVAIELIELPYASTPADLIQIVSERGLSEDIRGEALLFFEESEHPLEFDVLLKDQGIKHNDRVIVHRCRHIEVTVGFNARSEHRKFNPAVTVGRVKRWFVDEIGMKPVDASEHVLQIAGTSHRPDQDVPIGTLAPKGTCSLEFTLVPRKRVEG